MVKRITENWTAALLNMEVGEVVEFPLEKSESIVGSIIPRLRKECGEKRLIGVETGITIQRTEFSELKG